MYKDYLKSADSSVLIEQGDTKVLCAATISKGVPGFLENSHEGWVTAEYSLLPCSTSNRTTRESVIGKQGGRTLEIQRLIGRSLRAAVDRKRIAGYTIIIDCDVIQADGGTRAASITGGWVALYGALEKLCEQQITVSNPVCRQIAAVSVGIKDGEVLLDLDYEEDRNTDSDINVVMDAKGEIIEIQGTAEKKPFTQNEIFEVLRIAKEGNFDLMKMQLKTLYEK